ncbi:MAG: EamA family transporter [Lachnospiraceae bacterium]|nr:EamA family transporter [Lachnospiraceae bacterium]
MKMIKKAAPVFVTGAAVLWGILVIFIKNLSGAGLGSMEIVTLRVYGSALVLGAGLLLYNKKLFTVRLKDLWCFAGTGIVSIVFFSYCYFKNVTVSSVAVSSILMYTSPVWVTLLSRVVFGERLNRSKLTALIMAVAGCALVCGICGGVGRLSMEGLLLGLGSGIGYGLYSIFGRVALQKGYHPMTVSVYTFLFACLGVLPFVDMGALAGKMAAVPDLWGWAAAMVLLSTCMSFTLYTIGLKYMEAGRAAVLATLEPIVTACVGVVVYQEALTPFMILGMILVLAASVLISR